MFETFDTLDVKEVLRADNKRKQINSTKNKQKKIILPFICSVAKDLTDSTEEFKPKVEFIIV